MIYPNTATSGSDNVFRVSGRKVWLSAIMVTRGERLPGRENFEQQTTENRKSS